MRFAGQFFRMKLLAFGPGFTGQDGGGPEGRWGGDSAGDSHSFW